MTTTPTATTTPTTCACVVINGVAIVIVAGCTTHDEEMDLHN